MGAGEQSFGDSRAEPARDGSRILVKSPRTDKVRDAGVNFGPLNLSSSKSQNKKNFSKKDNWKIFFPMNVIKPQARISLIKSSEGTKVKKKEGKKPHKL